MRKLLAKGITWNPSGRQEKWLVGLITVGAFVFRVWALGYGLPHLYYDDEGQLVNYALAFGATRDLSFSPVLYPSLLMYVLSVLYGLYFCVGWILGMFHSPEADFSRLLILNPTGFYLIGRLFVALLGTANVLLVYLIGRKLYGRRTGLVAALLMVLAIEHVKWSHYIKPILPLTFMVSLTFLWICHLFKGGRNKDYALAGLFSGLSVATLQPGAFLAVPLLVAHILRATERGIKEVFRGKGLMWTVVCGVMGVVVGAPPFILNSKLLLSRSVERVRDLNLSIDIPGVAEGPLAHILLLPSTLGLGLAILAGIGVIYALWKHRREDILVLSFPIAYMVVFSLTRYKYGYYLMPTHPFLTLLAAVVVVELISRIRLSAFKWVATAAVLLPVLLSQAGPVVRWDYRLAQTDNRTLAYDWVVHNIPAGSSILLDSGHYFASTLNVPLQDSVENIRQHYNRVNKGQLFLNENLKPQPRPDYMHGRRLPMEAEYYKLQLEVLPSSNLPTYNLTRITHHIRFAEVLIHPLDYYIEHGVEYAIVSSWGYSRYYDPDYPHPEKAAAYRTFYESLDTQATLLMEFPASSARPGPTIKIHKLKSRSGDHQ